MPLYSSLARGLATAAVGGVLVTGVAVGPAVADNGGDNGDPGVTQQDNGGQGNAPTDNTDPGSLNGTGRYQGGVTARGGLWLRDRPDRGSRRVRLVREGQVVSIYCRTRGDLVGGNSLWYLLTDGTWAWGSARYIATFGPTPRWC
ncbi:SH3 domain-containing protein [Streptomyces sp. NPDC048521]|uniref:SH3 domain-containing protein n=1 Tax=Streptomyces sp. NPDC048521 TaxID=3365566 RepID=UPI003719D6D2